jgi:NOL1/NOP2/fmu family ribosome biogenesis protein
MMHSSFSIHGKIPWTDYGYYLQQRPSFTFDPLFHAGCYYVQEASSMFLEQALKQTTDLSKPLRVLDLCAAPGGKSTHLLSLISKDSLLVSNEVIRSRANILKDNLARWGCSNFIVTTCDPAGFGRLENYFDVILVDAPCSGSGLFRRDPDAIAEWSLNNVSLCSQRQQRILADILPSLKKDGVLIYSTCSYSKEEDEDILKWLVNDLSMENCRLQLDDRWGVVESRGGYRFWPDKLKGEGFFIACFRKTDGDKEFRYPKLKYQQPARPAAAVLKNWVDTEGLKWLVHRDMIHAIPEKNAADIHFLLATLPVTDVGLKVGTLIREKLVPDHALAMSVHISGEIEKIELESGQAIQYLRKKEMPAGIAGRGWKLVAFQGHPLGWINVLPNRVNNYYPKELRILKD